jgi:hypothetical protein
MDTVTLVDNQIDDGQRLLDQLAADGFVVRAACWVKPADEDRWSLYVVAPAVDAQGTLEAYRQVYGVLRSLEGACVTTSDIKLVGENHPVAKDVLDILRRNPAGGAPRSRRPLLGGSAVEEVYVYAPGKTEVTIYGMVFRGEPGGGALHLSFEPHDRHSKLVVDGNGGPREYPAETGIDWVVAAPEGAKLERSEHRPMMLVWDLHGRRMQSSANEVWSLAKLGLHGFRFLREPTQGNSASRVQPGGHG